MKKQAEVFAKKQLKNPSLFCIWVAEIEYKELISVLSDRKCGVLGQGLNLHIFFFHFFIICLFIY